MLCYTGTFQMFVNHKSTKQVSLLNLYQLNWLVNSVSVSISWLLKAEEAGHAYSSESEISFL